MSTAAKHFKRRMNWISAALLTLFVVSPGIFAANHVRSGITVQQIVTTFALIR